MQPLAESTTDAELIALIDEWVALLEREDYAAAIALTEQDPDQQNWTADGLREVIKSYGAATKRQRVTLTGVPSDVEQRKEVDRWKANARGEIGEIWYDLNIDGVVSDLTAIFRIVRVRGGVVVRLDDVHVM